MNYGELRTQFLELLNRDDCSDTLADRFIQMGLRRIERVLRTPLQRAIQTITVDGTFAGSTVIPTDFLGLYQIRVNGYPIPRLIADQRDKYGYYQDGAKFIFTLPITVGEVIDIEYYNEFDPSPGSTATTGYSLVMADAVIYSALVYAADHFLDARKADYDSTFSSIVGEIQAMSDMDVLSGGVSISPYGGGFI